MCESQQATQAVRAQEAIPELSGTQTDSIAKPGITVRQIPGQVSPLQKSPLTSEETMSTAI